MNESEAIDEFEDIRPYNDSEYREIIRRLAENDYLKEFLLKLRWANCPEPLIKPAMFFIENFLKRKFGKYKTIAEFQKEFSVGRVVKWIVDSTINGVTFSGEENIKKDEAYLYISNHRDIVLDAALINHFLVINGFPTTQIAFGDNLLINEFVADLIRINKSFIVKRNLPLREQITASTQLSKYINYTLNQGESIWIAQKEGRSKDGSDQTNPAVIKMFYLSKRKSGVVFSDFINNCKIIPVSISYELDPCDTLKGWEIHRKETRKDFKKTKTMDLLSIWTGMKGKKGRVHLHFGNPLSGEFNNDKAVAESLDKAIHSGYMLWPSNYISYDVVHKNKKYIDKYSQQEKEAFLNRFSKLSEPVLEKVLNMYAKPVTNQEEAVFFK